MAYKNIVFVKLEKRLLNDHRWYMMSDHAQLIYIKLILLAAETYNKIPKSDVVLTQAFRSELEIGKFKSAIEEIKKNFPKFKSNKHFYYFDEFEHKTNYLPSKQLLSKSQAIAEQGADKEEEEDKEEDKRKSKKSPLSDEDFIKTLKTKEVYKGVDIDRELGKMDAWLLIHPDRKKTRPFILRWLNKVDKPVFLAKKELTPADPNCSLCKGEGKFFAQGTSKVEVCKCRVKE